MTPTFVIYRILGNALPPRHGTEDTYNNLRFILEHEPDLPGCEKRWLLNRFLDKSIEKKCIDLIETHGQRRHIIPFDIAAYQNTFLDPTGIGKAYNPFTTYGRPNHAAPHPLAIEWFLRHKSQALININMARNHALDHGRDDAEWTLPLDGSCYFTAEGWSRLVEDLNADPDALYGIIPMARIDNNDRLSDATWQPVLDEEPQIAFRRDAPDRFDERLRYGNRNKVELLVRLGVPGNWKKSSAVQIENTHIMEPTAAGRFANSGWIYRLATGADKEIEKDGESRFYARIQGLQHLVNLLDADLLGKTYANHRQTPPISLRTINVPDTTLSLATAAFDLPDIRITDKTECPPGGNWQDYFSIPRYLHMIDGEPVQIDGYSNPAAIIGSVESRRYDRTALYEALRRISVLTAAGLLHERDDFLQKAVSILSCWFIDETTKMRPHARFAQFNPDKADQANFAGLIDFRDLWTLPRLCQHLLASGALTRDQFEAVRQWTTELARYLGQSPQGKTAFGAKNNIGTWMHLLSMSLALFNGNKVLASQLVSQASLRLASQIEVVGVQAGELVRTRPLHYSLFNMTAWVLLAHLGRSAGRDLWNYSGVEGQSLCSMLGFIQNNMKAFPEYANSPETFSTWLAALRLFTPATAANVSLLDPMPLPVPSQWHDDPDTGLPPQWMVLLESWTNPPQ